MQAHLVFPGLFILDTSITVCFTSVSPTKSGKFWMEQSPIGINRKSVGDILSSAFLARVLAPENRICLIVRLPVTLKSEVALWTWTSGISSREGSTHCWENEESPERPSSAPSEQRSGSIVML